LPRKLVDLEVHAVAGVDKAANRRRFLVVKRAEESEDATTADHDGIANEKDQSILKAAWSIIAKHLGLSAKDATVQEASRIIEALPEAKEKGDTNMAQTGTQNVDLDAILKDASDEVKAAVKAAFAKQEEKLAELQKQVDELSKKGEGNADDINKADLPEHVRKRLEDLEKRAKEAEEIAKAEREARVRAEIRKRAEGYANVGEVEKIAEAIYKAQSVSAEFAEQLETLLKSAHERIEKGDLFKEFGSGAGDSASTAWGKIEAAAAEIMKATPSMTRPQAIAKALEANPELEKAYYEEVRR